MLARIRRDDALRFLPLWFLLSFNVAAVFFGTLTWRGAHTHAPISAGATLWAAWLAVAIFLLFGRVRRRATGFDLALPVPARRIWLAHVVAVILAGVVLVAASVAAAALQRNLLAAHVPLGIGPAGLAGMLFACLPLAVVLLEAWRPGLARAPAGPGYWLWAMFVLAGVPALVLVLWRLGPAGPALAALCAVAVGYAVYRSIPPAFTMAPARLPAAAARDVAREAEAPGRKASRWAVRALLTRSLTAGAKEALAVLAVPFFGFILGGGLVLVSDDPGLLDLRYIYVPFASYLLFAFLATRLMRLHHLDALPVSRAVLFAGLMIPQALVFLLGYGAGRLALDARERGAELVNLYAGESRSFVTVPTRYWQISWSGPPAPVTAPWGERHVPAHYAMFRGGRACFYSPFSTPAGSSVDFVAWQLSRAARAVYGASIAPEEIRERYLEVSGGRVVPKGGRFALRRDHPGLAPRGGSALDAVMMALAFCPWLIASAALFGTCRAGVPEWGRLAVYWGALGLIFAFVVAFMGLIFTRWMGSLVLRGLFEIGDGKLGLHPLGVAAAWLVCGALLLASYWLAHGQFARMEIPAKPMRLTLLDLYREEG